MANVGVEDLNLENSRIKLSGKGDKEGFLIFGQRTKIILAQYLQDWKPTDRLLGLNT